MRSSAAVSAILLPAGPFIISGIRAWDCRHHHGRLDSLVMGALYPVLISRSNASRVTYDVTFGR